MPFTSWHYQEQSKQQNWESGVAWNSCTFIISKYSLRIQFFFSSCHIFASRYTWHVTCIKGLTNIFPEDHLAQNMKTQWSSKRNASWNRWFMTPAQVPPTFLFRYTFLTTSAQPCAMPAHASIHSWCPSSHLSTRPSAFPARKIVCDYSWPPNSTLANLT